MKFYVKRDVNVGTIRVKGPGALFSVSEDTAMALAKGLTEVAQGKARGCEVTPETDNRGADLSTYS